MQQEITQKRDRNIAPSNIFTFSLLYKRKENRIISV